MNVMRSTPKNVSLSKGLSQQKGTCESIKRGGTEDDIEERNITLFLNKSLSDTEILMVEALGPAVIDTACTRTVCGENWLD